MIAKIKSKWEEIPYIKKIAIVTAVILTVLIIIGLNNPVFSEETKTFDWKHPIQSVVNYGLTNICDEIFSSLLQVLMGSFVTIFDVITNIAIYPFGKLSNHTLETVINSVSMTTEPVDLIKKFAVAVGLLMATIILFFSLFCYFFSGKITDSKDTPVSLLAKYIVVVAVLIKNESVINTVESLFDSLYSQYVNWGLSGGGVFGALKGQQGSYDGLFDFAEDGALKMFGMTFTALHPGILLLLLICGIVFLFKIIKAVTKLYCEMISRYIITTIFVWFLPAFIGTYVSNNTSSIFSSYVRTLLSSMLLLIFSALWFKVCTFCAIAVILDPTTLLNGVSLIMFIFVLELCKFGNKFDGMLKSMGIGIATGMSRVGSACGGSLRNMGRSFDTANRMRKSGGEALMAAAPVMGASAGTQEKMFNAGMKMSGSLADNIGNKNDPNPRFAESAHFGANGQQVPGGWSFSPDDSANIIGRSLLNPDSRQCQDALRGLGDERLKEGAQAIMGNGFKVEDAMIASYKGSDGKTHTGIAISGSYADGVNASKTLVSQKTGGGKGIDGMDGLGVVSNNSLEKGQKSSFKSEEELRNVAGDKAAEAFIGGGGKFGGNKSVEYTGKDASGKDSFRFRDSAGNVEGSVNGSGYTKSASSLSGGEQREMTEQLTKDLESRGYSVVTDENGKSWSNDAGDSSKWHATVQQTDSDGKGVGDKYNVTATSIGDNPTANPDSGNPNNFKSSYSSSGGDVDSYVTFGNKVRENTNSYGNKSGNDKWGTHPGNKKNSGRRKGLGSDGPEEMP